MQILSRAIFPGLTVLILLGFLWGVSGCTVRGSYPVGMSQTGSHSTADTRESPMRELVHAVSIQDASVVSTDELQVVLRYADGRDGLVGIALQDPPQAELLGEVTGGHILPESLHPVVFPEGIDQIEFRSGQINVILTLLPGEETVLRIGQSGTDLGFDALLVRCPYL